MVFQSKFSYEFRITAIKASIQLNSQRMLDRAFVLSYFTLNDFFDNELIEANALERINNSRSYCNLRVIIAPNNLPGRRAF